MRSKLLTRPAVGMIVLTLLWAAVSLFVDSSWRMVLTLPYLVLVPGYLLYIILARNQQTSWWKLIGYSIGLSLTFLMLSGLALNAAYLASGINTPLSRMPLTGMISLSVLFLAAIAYIHRPPLGHPAFGLNRHWRWWAVVISGLLLPVMTAIGAFLLNNNGTNAGALLALGSVGMYAMLGVWAGPATRKLHPYMLYMMCLSILLSVSLRGWGITGHDIMQEFQVFQYTNAQAEWLMSNYQDAYNACLSITILPTILQRLTGIPDPYIYKVVYQLMFALISPIMYIYLRQYVPRVIAYLSAFVFLSFPAFILDMPMLNRQEVALICFALALLATIDKSLLSTRTRHTLAFVLLIGMVVSHYSTSYVTLMILLGGVLISWFVRLLYKLWPRRLRALRAYAKSRPMFPAWVVISALVALIAWNGLITHTANNMAQVARELALTLTGKAKKPATVSNIPPKDKAKMVGWYADYEKAHREYGPEQYYPASVTDKYPVVRLDEKPDKVTKVGESLHLSGNTLYAIYDTFKLAYSKAVPGLIIIGLGIYAFYNRRRWVYQIPPNFIALAVAALVVIVLQVVLPAEAINYGLVRLIQQNLLLLALPMIIACVWFLSLLRIPRRVQPTLIALPFVAGFLVLSGCLPALTGGYKPTLAVKNDGLYYQAYYTHQQEIAAARWMSLHTPEGSRVYADEFQRRKMIPYSGIYARPTLLPVATPLDSYVALSKSNMETGMVPVYVGIDVVYYNVPISFLDDNKNLVYSTGSVRIYK